MKELTERQKQLIEFIRESIATTGFPPTVSEIAEAMNVKSTNGIRGHLQALARKGAIELTPNASRGIRLVEPDTEEQGLPIIGRVAAGDPVLAQQHIEDYYSIDASMFHPRADYLLRVHGTSMQDIGILDGDLLAVHSTSQVNNGQIVVARIEEEVTVKRIQQKKHMVYLHAENPEFDTIKVDMRNEFFAIEGVAVGVLRQL